MFDGVQWLVAALLTVVTVVIARRLGRLEAPAAIAEAPSTAPAA